MSEHYQRPICPACNNRLVHSIEINGGSSNHVVYCGNSRCVAQPTSNEGAEGATLEDAMKKLTAAIEEEAL